MEQAHQTFLNSGSSAHTPTTFHAILERLQTLPSLLGLRMPSLQLHRPSAARTLCCTIKTHQFTPHFLLSLLLGSEFPICSLTDPVMTSTALDSPPHSNEASNDGLTGPGIR